MDQDKIVSDYAVMFGKPVIAGTRITVELILEQMATGQTVEQILESYPHLTREGVLAAIAYAVRVFKADVVLPIPKNPA